MKKLWHKFKHWLIKNLGGQIVEVRYADPIAISKNIDVDFDFLTGDRVFKEQQIRRELALKISGELLDRGLIEITTEDDLIYWQRRYKGRVMVYNERESGL